MGSSVVVQGNKGFILLELCMNNIHNLDSIVVKNIDGVLSAGGSFAEFGWDSKHAAVIVLFSRFVSSSTSTSAFTLNADKFVCSILPNHQQD